MRSENTKQKPSEVWFADLGMIEKSRPVLVLSSYSDANARSLVVVAPLTSQIRGGFGEVALGKLPWLPKLSAVNVQGLASVDRHKLVRRLGVLSTEKMNEVKSMLRELLEL